MSFEKYARAISDKREKRLLRTLYVARIVLPIISVVLWVAALFFASFYLLGVIVRGAFGHADDPQQDAGTAPKQSTPPILDATFLVFVVSAVIALCCLIAFIVVSIVFFVKVKKLCDRPAVAGEPEEIVEYRQRFAVYINAERKATGWAFYLFVACVAAFIILFIVCFIFKVSILGSLAITILHDGAVIYLLTSIVYAIGNSKNTRALAYPPENAENAYGSPSSTSAEKDKDLYLSCVYPFPDLFEEAKSLERASEKRSAIVIAVSAALLSIALLVDLRWFSGSFLRYLFPVFILLSYFAVLIALRPLEKKRKELNENNENLLRSDEKFTPNLDLFEKFADHAKRSKIVLNASCLVSAALGFFMAFTNKNYILFIFCFAIIILAALFVRLRFNSLQKGVVGIRREMTETNASAAENETSETEDEQS